MPDDPYAAALEAAKAGGGSASQTGPDPYSAALEEAKGSPAAPDVGGIRFDPARAAIIGHSLLRGMHEGLDVPAEAMARAADWVARKFGIQSNQGEQTTAADQAFNTEYDTNPLNQGFVPAAVRLGGNMLTTLPAAGVAGSVASGFVGAGSRLAAQAAGRAAPYVGAAASNLPMLAGGAAGGATIAAQTGQPIEEGAALGGALGAGTSALAGGANLLMANRAPGIARAVDTYGIPLRAGQVSGNSLIRYLDDITAPTSANTAQRAAVTAAVAKGMGITPEIAAANGLPVGKITPTVMDFARKMNGGVMNEVEQQTTIHQTPEIMGAIRDITAEAAKTPSAFDDLKPHIKDILNTFEANGGTIPGTEYGKLIAHGTPLDVATNADNSTVRNYAIRLKTVLEDAMEASATPENAARYAQARMNYKNMMTIKPLVNKGIPGEISPLLLQGAANRSFKSNAFRGAGDLGELGDLAQQYLKAPPQSGTEPREFVRGALYGDIKRLIGTASAITAGRAVQGVLGRNPLQPFAIPEAGAIRPGAPAAVLLSGQGRNLLLDQSRRE